MLQNYKIELLLAVIIASVLVIFDIAVRLTADGEQSTRDWSYETPTAFKVNRLDGERRKELESFLSQYKKQQDKEKIASSAQPKNDKPKAHIPSAEEQAKQNGMLTGLYDGQSLYRLVATFEQQQPFAVVEQKQLDNGKKGGITSVRIGEQVGSYLVTAVKPAELQLERGEQRIQLQLFQFNTAHKGKVLGQ